VAWRLRGPQRAVNVEQTPKTVMRRPTSPGIVGKAGTPGQERVASATWCSAGVLTAARVDRESETTREFLVGGRDRPNRKPARVQAGPVGMADGPV
jgi:hypothetical protein